MGEIVDSGSEISGSLGIVDGHLVDGHDSEFSVLSDEGGTCTLVSLVENNSYVAGVFSAHELSLIKVSVQYMIYHVYYEQAIVHLLPRHHAFQAQNQIKC